MKRWVGAALLGLALAACEPPDTEKVPEAPAATNEAAPPFALETLDGGQVTLDSLRGKPVVLDFWATWCAPCEDQIPVLNAFQAQYGERVSVIGISVDWDRKAVAPFAAKLRVSYPVLYGDEQLGEQYGVLGLPTLFVLGPDGRIQTSHIGIISLTELEAAVAPLVGGGLKS
jgi:thiol-disulfide isomerase/thioredoxin